MLNSYVLRMLVFLIPLFAAELVGKRRINEIIFKLFLNLGHVVLCVERVETGGPARHELIFHILIILTFMRFHFGVCVGNAVCVTQTS